jgi:hypothetical protein
MIVTMEGGLGGDAGKATMKAVVQSALVLTQSRNRIAATEYGKRQAFDRDEPRSYPDQV